MRAPLDADAYNRHAPRLMALAAALVGPTDAGDVVSSAITLMIANEPSRRIDNLEAYLTRAVVNEARSWTQASARRGAWDARWVQQTSVRDADAIQGLSDPEFTAVLLRAPHPAACCDLPVVLGRLGPAAIADQLGISEGSVRKHLARACWRRCVRHCREGALVMDDHDLDGRLRAGLDDLAARPVTLRRGPWTPWGSDVRRTCPAPAGPGSSSPSAWWRWLSEVSPPLLDAAVVAWPMPGRLGTVLQHAVPHLGRAERVVVASRRVSSRGCSARTTPAPSADRAVLAVRCCWDATDAISSRSASSWTVTERRGGSAA